MENKILSVIIPTYNMAALLPRCLDSLLNTETLESLEVIAVNDGSKDSSLEIARDYEQRFPHTITVIDKPNGNYGSTINAALPVAKGRYVKILDADDWYDTTALVETLKALDNCNDDLIVEHFTQHGPGAKKEVIKYNTMNKEVYEYGKTYSLDAVLKDGYIKYFVMHSIAYRTDFLRSIEYKQTEGISYTDTEWACYPIFHAKTVKFLDLNLYQYNLDREGQTMVPAVLAKCTGQFQTVVSNLFAYYGNHAEHLSSDRMNWIKLYLANRVRFLFKLYLIDMDKNTFAESDFSECFVRFHNLCTEYDIHPTLYPENRIIRMDYIKYYNRKHHRWPCWLQGLNHILDNIMRSLYVRFIRK